MKHIVIFIVLVLDSLCDSDKVYQDRIEIIKGEIQTISHLLSPDNNIWLKSYSNYNLYLDLKERLNNIEKEIQQNGLSHSLLNSKNILEKQLRLFGEINSPFEKLIQPPNHETVQPITTPFDIFTSFSHINQNIQHMNEYQKRVNDVNHILNKLHEKKKLYLELFQLDPSTNYQDEFQQLLSEIKIFEETLTTLKTTFEIYKKRIDEVNFEIEREVKAHLETIGNIVTIILILLLFSFVLKYLSGQYLDDNQRIYMTNKAINFITISIIILIITFTYIDNINYIVTILGFASAGLAIAMKDGFMSIFGWFIIMFGGSIKAGDRIKVTMDGAEYVGDILDISFLKITIQEDVTLTTYNLNRRAGRIIFVPNNYIFTNLIVNYSHYTLRTVWDGIDIIITFDSNHKKAMHIMKEIAKNYSSGYTDMTRKQLNKLRDRYNLRNTNVEPRMFSFIDSYGIKLSVWYLTNAYATLTLRSNISSKIVDSFNAEPDIKIAYPTQQINIDNRNIDIINENITKKDIK